ncbi:MAG: ribonuclease HI family protein, partial [Desulfobulbaceae bacterium]|nr:ribonuclease HI family protein [Desulfobulbaceae bacterium]
MRQAGDILRVLVKKMPDEVLQDYFGDLSPAQVRKILQDAAAVLAPPKEEKSRPSPQANLWQGKDRDWKGKLKGTTLYLYSDGASRGNPGEAGAGIAILDEQGNELVATGEYLGQCTNNEAEYRALLFGLAKCKEFGRGRIKTHLDSELIVKQILGQYRVKHPNLIPLFKETMKRFADFASFSVVHVRREK